MAERREEGIRLLQAGELRQVQIARHLGITEAAVSKWKKKLEEDGPQSLELHKATGRPPKLETDDKQRLLDKLNKGAVASGFRADLWDLELVDKMIKQEFGVSYNQNYIYHLLSDLKWRIQKPGPRGNLYEEEMIIDSDKYELQITSKDYQFRHKIVVTIRFNPKMIGAILALMKIINKFPEKFLKSNSEPTVLRERKWNISQVWLDLVELGSIRKSQLGGGVARVIGGNLEAALAGMGFGYIPSTGTTFKIIAHRR